MSRWQTSSSKRLRSSGPSARPYFSDTRPAFGASSGNPFADFSAGSPPVGRAPAASGRPSPAPPRAAAAAPRPMSLLRSIGGGSLHRPGGAAHPFSPSYGRALPGRRGAGGRGGEQRFEAGGINVRPAPQQDEGAFQHQPEPSFAVPRDHGLGRFQPAPQASQAGVPYAEENELRYFNDGFEVNVTGGQMSGAPVPAHANPASPPFVAPAPTNPRELVEFTREALPHYFPADQSETNDSVLAKLYAIGCDDDDELYVDRQTSKVVTSHIRLHEQAKRLITSVAAAASSPAFETARRRAAPPPAPPPKQKEWRLFEQPRKRPAEAPIAREPAIELGETAQEAVPAKDVWAHIEEGKGGGEGGGEEERRFDDDI
ncbi:hypothetical protein TeGR_g10676 [Tetraparma gracilis]|uniref:Uncharacterized protein n=1 Tax=Tetraparma gracilis TaxID=2962635 RepID=A0ABQ6NAG1_9STRA|nr:hypothetical protein TeGR_g10676 [Tetraparma gracilis]